MTAFQHATTSAARRSRGGWWLLALWAALAPCTGLPATINGTIFEDPNYGGGAGRPRATAGTVVLPNVRVELYRQSNGNFIAAATTDGAGAYSLSSGNNNDAVYVRVVTGTIRSQRTGAANCTTCVPVQTFRTVGSGNTVVDVVNQVGGPTPSISDAAQNNGNFSNLTTATSSPHSVAAYDPTANNSVINGVDFGYNFDTVVAVRDAANCTPSGTNNTFFPCQGTLRQFMINANAIGGSTSLSQSGSRQIDGSTSSLPSGFETSIFMVPNGLANAGQAAGLTNQLNGSGVAVITLATALPNLTRANARLDGTTQTVNIGNTNAGTLGTGGKVGVDNLTLPTYQRPEVQLDSAASGSQLTLAAANQAIHGFALRQGYILLSGAGCTARNNLVGMTATGSSTDNSTAFYGITFSGAGSIVRGNFVTVNNSGIRSDSASGANSTISENEVARPAFGHDNTYDGILLINGASGVNISGNLTRDQRGGGIELGFGATSDVYSNISISNNTVSNNGYNSGTTQSTEDLGMAMYNFTASGVTISRNRIQNNGGPGLVILGARGITITQNSFSNNRTLAIDLDPTTRDPNGLGTPNGPTLNDNNDSDNGPNDLLNFPVLTNAAIISGQLQLRGFARPGSRIELYIAQADASGFGEGLTYLTTLDEGSAADLSTATGTYGPAAINGVAQGTDTTNEFLFRIAVPSGVAVGTQLTMTATLSANTSEFNGLTPVTSGPSLVHLKTVSVLNDPINTTPPALPKSIPGAEEMYVVRLTNTGGGVVDANTIAVVDPIPTNTCLFVGNLGSGNSGPVLFTDGSPTSNLTYNYVSLSDTGDRLDFSNNGGTSWGYVPTPGAFSCDPAVTHIRVRPLGTMAGSNAWFELRFKVRVN